MTAPTAAPLPERVIREAILNAEALENWREAQRLGHEFDAVLTEAAHALREAAAALAQREEVIATLHATCAHYEERLAIAEPEARAAQRDGIARDDARRLDWAQKHIDGIDVKGSGAADDKWWEVIHHDGRRAEGATLREAIDAAMTSESGEQKSADAALHEPTPTEQPAVLR